MQTNPVAMAVAAVWTAYDTLGDVLRADKTGQGNTPACEAAGQSYYEAYAALLATRPSTLAEVAEFARAAIRLSQAMATDDYLDNAYACSPVSTRASPGIARVSV